MSRMSQKVALAFVGSAAVLLTFFACAGCWDDWQNRDPNNRTYSGTSYRRRSYWGFGPSWGYGGSGYRSYGTSNYSSRPSSPSPSHSTVSRGGFGSTGRSAVS